ncbi:MAG: hypothetical protein AAGB29_01130 [Planctomycetota bacterium]
MPDPSAPVQPLPARPSLEKQQKLAKQLARDVWSRQPDAVERFTALHPAPPEPEDAKLADVQLVIARGHGFASWADLKRKIESLTKSPLDRWIDAVRRGDTDHVRELFDRHPELDQHVNDQAFAFNTSAVFAAVNGQAPNLELLDLLIEHGADVNRKSGWTAGGFGLAENHPPEVAEALLQRGVVEDIWVAVGLDRIERVRSLLDNDPSLVHAPGGDGKQPLHYAASPEMVNLLVDRGAGADARDVDHGSTPAQYLVNEPAVVRRLLDRGATPDLFMAAALGDEALARRCIDEDAACVTHRLGVAPWLTGQGEAVIYNWTLGHALTPLDVAHERGHANVHRLILNACPTKHRFLDAARRGDLDAARELRTTTPDVMRVMTEDDHAALNRACWWYRPNAVAAMLALGFDRHVQDHEKMTPLDRATFHGHADCLARLLDGDPDPPLDWKHQYDGTPLQTCIHGALHGWPTGFPQDHARCAELLLDAGAALEPAWLPTGHDAIDRVLRQRL